MAEQTATATAPTQEPVVKTETAPVIETKTTETVKTETKPVETKTESKSPVSTTKTTSIISDAGKTPATDASKDGKSILDGAKAEGTEVAKEGEAKKEGEADKTVPEKYDIKAPEGMTLDEKVLEEFTPIAKELGLSNEQVQKLADFEAQRTVKAQQAQTDGFNKFVEDTKAESIKFFGPKLEAELPFVAKGRDNFADAEVMDLLERTGLSNHKAVIKMFAKMGRAVSEDKLVEGKNITQEDTRTPGQIIYAKDKT